MKGATVVVVVCFAVLAMVVSSQVVLARNSMEPVTPHSLVFAPKVGVSPAGVSVKHLGRSPLQCIWGSTYDARSHNTGTLGSIPEEGDQTLPVTDPNYDPNPSVIDWPFSLEGTSWLDPDQGRTEAQQILLVGYDANDRYTGLVWAMNDGEYLYLAFEADKAPLAEGARSQISFYFDPDHFTEPGAAHFVKGSAFMVSFDVLETGNVDLAASGWWVDWERDDLPGAPVGNNGDEDKSTPLTAWPVQPWVTDGIAYSAGFAPNMSEEGDARKTGRWHFQMRVPIEYLGCHTSLGSRLGVAICYLDDENADGTVEETGAGSEELWWPVDIEDTGSRQEEGWDPTDAMYMGDLDLSYRGTGDICRGDRLWGVYFDLTELEETTWLVLKNPNENPLDPEEMQQTAIRFYEADFDPQTGEVDYSGGNRAGLLIANASMCISIPSHGVYVLNLRDVVDRETGDPGVLENKIGAIEVSNPNLTGYVVHMRGISTGIYASSVDLLPNSPSVSEYNRLWPDLTPTPERAVLVNKYYTVAQSENYTTKLAIFNPSCCYSAVARLNFYEWPGTDAQNQVPPVGPTVPPPSQTIAEFELPPHQTVVYDLHNVLTSAFIASNPLYRRGSIEIEILDGDDPYALTENEILIGTTWRFSATQAYADAMRVYYFGPAYGP